MHPRTETVPLLIARIDKAFCAIPIAHVVETLRPLPLAPPEHEIFVGSSMIRGVATPVLDLGAGPEATRWVVLRIGDRYAGLRVDEVVGVRTIATDELARCAGLPQSAAGDRVSAADPELARVLASARLLPELPA